MQVHLPHAIPPGSSVRRGAKQIPARGWPQRPPSAALKVGRTGGRRGRRASKTPPQGPPRPARLQSAPAIHSCGSGGALVCNGHPKTPHDSEKYRPASPQNCAGFNPERRLTNATYIGPIGPARTMSRSRPRVRSEVVQNIARERAPKARRTSFA